jgi:predicted Rossmann-fold nucleotide-binding protein
VTIFDSARITEGVPEYELAREVGGRLGEAGFSIVTGGGPGVMEGANRGAMEAGARRG